jgi:hypothetical protein
MTLCNHSDIGLFPVGRKMRDARPPFAAGRSDKVLFARAGAGAMNPAESTQARNPAKARSVGARHTETLAHFCPQCQVQFAGIDSIPDGPRIRRCNQDGIVASGRGVHRPEKVNTGNHVN